MKHRRLWVLCSAAALLILVAGSAFFAEGSRRASPVLQKFDGIVMRVEDEKTLLVYTENLEKYDVLVRVALTEETDNEIKEFMPHQSIHVGICGTALGGEPPVLTAAEISRNDVPMNKAVKKAEAFFTQYERLANLEDSETE